MSVFGTFRTEAGGAWEVEFSDEALRRWRIRRTPAGVLPPWRASADDRVAAGEQPDRRWWVFPPDSLAPVAASSTWATALRHVEDTILTQLIRQNLQAATLLHHTPKRER